MVKEYTQTFKSTFIVVWWLQLFGTEDQDNSSICSSSYLSILPKPRFPHILRHTPPCLFLQAIYSAGLRWQAHEAIGLLQLLTKNWNTMLEQRILGA